jgi:HEAT repeat protein
MDNLAEVISRFRESPRERLGLIDNLYLALPDSRAFELLLATATDTTEAETVRCAAWKVWHNNEPDSEDELERFVAAALATVRSDPSDLVRDYAICALAWQAHREDVEAVLLSLLQDSSAGQSVRSAAFQVLSRRGHERREAVFRTLTDDPVLGDEVRDYFSE